MENLYILFVLVLIIFLTILVSKISKTDNDKHLPEFYHNINEREEIETINATTLPLIESTDKYIELQTKEWINQRRDTGYCYGLLEKDKIVMTKWIEKFNIKTPKIYYYNYHKDFIFNHLKKVALDNPDKKFIIKISHLQSNYGIIMVPSYNEEKNDKYLLEIYNKCIQKFKTCFVCNHDKDSSPTVKEIKKGLKESHYKLYETIEPGIIIQEFFHSKENKSNAPLEFKILVYGDKIIDGVKNTDYQRCEPVYKMAKYISKILGASLIRVDMFVKENDNPYIPYLNEISLSPNGGFKTKHIEKNDLFNYQTKLKKLKPIDMGINELLKECPFRTIPVEKYLTDKDWEIWWKEKYRFGLLK